MVRQLVKVQKESFASLLYAEVENVIAFHSPNLGISEHDDVTGWGVHTVDGELLPAHL